MSENKTIVRARKIIQTRLEKINAEYTDAYMLWIDTGYSRYQAKMDKLDAERSELEDWMSGRALMETRSENSHLRRELGDLRYMLDNLKRKVSAVSEKNPDNLDIQDLERLLEGIR